MQQETSPNLEDEDIKIADPQFHNSPKNLQKSPVESHPKIEKKSSSKSKKRPKSAVKKPARIVPRPASSK